MERYFALKMFLNFSKIKKFFPEGFLTFRELQPAPDKRVSYKKEIPTETIYRVKKSFISC